MHKPDSAIDSTPSKPAGLSARQLHRRYIVALSLIALLTIVSQAFIQYLIADQEHDSRVVNIAGRQRMLSQKITKTSFYIANAESAEASNTFRKQLAEALALWKRSHNGLQNGDQEMGLPGDNSREIKLLFQKIESNHQAIIRAADAIIASPNNASTLKRAINTIQQNESDFLLGMDAIVFRFDKEAKDKIEVARWLELALMLTTLVVLVLEAVLIFAPATRRIRRDMQNLAEREQDLARLFDASPIAMMMVDMNDLTILRANQKALELTKLVYDALLQQPLGSLLDSSYDANRNFLEKLRGDKVLNEFEITLLDTNHDVLESLVSSRIVEFAGRFVYVLGFTNIHELKIAQQGLEYHATYDALTGLVNRRTGLMFLENAMARAKRDKTLLAVIFADLDGLKIANDTFGHAEGDRLLRTAAQAVTGLIRTSDFAARLGGDEFLIILPNCPLRGAQKIVDNLEHFMNSLNDGTPHQAVYSISCGIAEYAADRHATPDDLIAEADEKMYRVKQEKKMRADQK
ncbi:MAG: diguanylate cyclase [Oxalobacter sp.]|nr:MAG: diguanylate cyclase [Oxalobacter sp.]